MTKLFLKTYAVLPAVLLGLVVGLQNTAASAATITSVAGGGLNDGATWDGGLAPIAGDMNVWEIDAETVTATSLTWEGQELLLTGGLLRSGGANATVEMNGDFTLDGGEIRVLNNGLFTFDLNDNTFTLNSGLLQAGNNPAVRDLVITNAKLAGSGLIDIRALGGPGPNRGDVIFGAGLDTTGFTGILQTVTRGRLVLPDIVEADASFGVVVGGTGRISLANDFSVTSATVNGNVLAPGTYTSASSELSGFVASGPSGGSLTVVAPAIIPEPGAISLALLACSVVAVRRRSWMS